MLHSYTQCTSVHKWGPCTYVCTRTLSETCLPLPLTWHVQKVWWHVFVFARCIRSPVSVVGGDKAAIISINCRYCTGVCSVFDIFVSVYTQTITHWTRTPRFDASSSSCPKPKERRRRTRPWLFIYNAWGGLENSVLVLKQVHWNKTTGPENGRTFVIPPLSLFYTHSAEKSRKRQTLHRVDGEFRKSVIGKGAGWRTGDSFGFQAWWWWWRRAMSRV